MIDIGTILRHYKRKEIQEEIVKHAEDKEIAIRFNDSFGKRPDILKYPADVLELAKQGATSFHASEEIWRNPLHLRAEMRKKELDELRIGWDLVLDIDCPHWGYSKVITHILIRSLKDHKVKSISCKFSGNKGFHIGVPFEAFPKTFYDKDVKERFPDDTRIISKYLIDHIEKNYVKEITGMLQNKDKKEVAENLGIAISELSLTVCKKCCKEIKKIGKKESASCIYCGRKNKIKEKSKFFQCSHCKKLVKIEQKETKCSCGSKNFEEKLNISRILNVDAILISSRHMYRMPYSLHEKSGLCSIPIDPAKIPGFEKKMAKPENVKVSRFRFLDRGNIPKNDAKNLFEEAFKWHTKLVKENEEIKSIYEKELRQRKEFEVPKSGVEGGNFPPCIKKIFEGLSDGRKRSLFILTNFLTSVGWGYDKIEEKLKEWNDKNDELLREVNIKGQIRYHKQRNKMVLPPNCSNKMYYADMQVCKPDALCEKIRNPVSYALRRVRYSGGRRKK